MCKYIFDWFQVKDMMVRVCSKWTLYLLSVGSKQVSYYSQVHDLCLIIMFIATLKRITST